MEEITVDELHNAAAYCAGINTRSRNSYERLHVTISHVQHATFLHRLFIFKESDITRSHNPKNLIQNK